MSSSGSDESKGQKIVVTVRPGREYLPSTPVGGSDELRDELERVFQAMNPEHTQLSDFVDAARPVVVRRVAGAKAEALNEVADFLDGRGILWHGDSGVTVMGQPYSGQLGLRLTDWLRAQAVASEGNVSRFPTGSEQETL